MKLKQNILSIDESLKLAISNADLIWSLVDSEIQKPEPLLCYKNEPVIFQNSTILIQGKTGTHKSRFAAALISLLISPDPHFEMYGFSKGSNSSNPVLYIDTERDKKVQLPLMIQQLLKDTNLSKADLKARIFLLPLAEIFREQRIFVMGKQIRELCELNETKDSLVIVTDVISDLTKDFNSVEATNLINDVLNIANSKFNVTFITIIHENPGEGEKARGHLGTELTNKASTIFQISEVKNMKHVFRIKMLKSRTTERYDEVLLKFDPIANNLKLVTDDEMISKASDPELYKLGLALANKGYEPLERLDLISYLEQELKWKERKIEGKLKAMVDKKVPFETIFGSSILTKERGKKLIYKIIALKEEEVSISNDATEIPKDNILSKVDECSVIN